MSEDHDEVPSREKSGGGNILKYSEIEDERNNMTQMHVVP